MINSLRKPFLNRQKYSDSNLKGYLTVLAGFILMIFNGSSFMVGNIAEYIQSYFPDASL